MMQQLRISLLVAWVSVALATSLAQTTTEPQPQTGETVVERVGPSVVLVLARAKDGAEVLATGVVGSADGIVFTAYHAVKDAREVQIRLKSGEIFDRVELVGSDARRDVAALRISATGLVPLPMASVAELHAGQQVFVISNPAGLNWTASAGILSAVRMADEVPGAGSGFRVLQFSAPVSPGSSGGVVVDAQGRALGIVVGSLVGGQNLNFAVPLESVAGLGHSAGGRAFASGADLRPMNEREPAPGPPASEAPPRREPVGLGDGSGPVAQPVNPSGPELSNSIQSRDTDQILRSFRSICVLSKTNFAKPEVIQSALQREPAYAAWGLMLVSDPKVADLRLTIDRPLFTFTYTYELVHQKSGIILDTGRVKGASDGDVSPKIASALMAKIASARGWPEGLAPKKGRD